MLRRCISSSLQTHCECDVNERIMIRFAYHPTPSTHPFHQIDKFRKDKAGVSIGSTVMNAAYTGPTADALVATIDSDAGITGRTKFADNPVSAVEEYLAGK